MTSRVSAQPVTDSVESNETQDLQGSVLTVSPSNEWGHSSQLGDLGFSPADLLVAFLGHCSSQQKGIQWKAVEWFPTWFIINRTGRLD